MGELKKAAEEKGIQPGGQKTIADVLKSQWHKIEAVMPQHMSSERLLQLAISTVNHDPKLAQCDIATLLSCVMKCSALGLEPSAVDGLGRAYLLPFKNHGRMEATFILGYKGMLDLARRSGEVMDISARAVYEGDEFEYEFGLDEKCRHIPHADDRNPDNLTHVYMVCHFKDGGHYLDVMTKAEVDAIRKRSKSPNNGPWVTDYEAMAKKTVIRRAFPFLPVSVEAQTAAASDETTGGYEDILEGIDAPVVPVPESAEIVEVEEAAESQEKAPEAKDEAEQPKRAVCKSCGNVVDLKDGQRASDVKFECCADHNYVEEA